MSRRYEYDTMPAGEFRAWLRAGDWPEGYRFAKAFGFDPSRIRRCIAGTEAVAPAQAICAMLAARHPEIRETALAWVEERSRPKHPTRDNGDVDPAQSNRDST